MAAREAARGPASPTVNMPLGMLRMNSERAAEGANDADGPFSAARYRSARGTYLRSIAPV